MKKNFVLGVILSAVTLLGFSLLQVSAQMRTRDEVFRDIDEYLSTLKEGVFPVHKDWPADMLESVDEVKFGIADFRESAASDVSQSDHPGFLMHRK